MMSNFLNRTIAGLFVLAGVIAIVAIVTSQTLLNANYLKGQLKQNNAYNRLSTALTQQVAQQTGYSSTQINSLAQQYVPSGTVEQRVNSAIDQLEAYEKGQSGAAPTINFNDLVQQAQNAGVPVPSDTALSQPISLAPTSGATKGSAANINTIKTIAIIVAIVLFVLLLLTSWRSKRYGTLPNMFISIGAIIGIIALFCLLTQGLLKRFVPSGLSSNGYASIGQDLASSISRDLGHRYGIIAIILLAVGIVTRILVAVFLKPQRPQAARPVAPTPTPTV